MKDDGIKYMDNHKIENMSTSDFTNLVKNNKNKEVSLTIQRENELLDFKLEREIIELKSLFSKIIENEDKKVGYIYISLFAANTDEQFMKELKLLENKKIDSLIIDVRDNSGGHLKAVENIISQFLDKKHVIYQIQDKKNTKKVYSKGEHHKKYKITILVNEISASASEMLAASLQEEYKAVVVGKNTFGKGTVQKLIDSNNLKLDYKITTEKWLTPKGNWINKKGVKPDYEIDLSEDYFNDPNDQNDDQLKKALEILTK